MEDEDEAEIVDKNEDEDGEEEAEKSKSEIKDKEEDRMKSLTLQANKYVPPCPVPFERHAAKYIKANEDKFKIELQTEEALQRHELYEAWYLGPQYKIFKGKPYVEEEPKKKGKGKKKEEDEEMVDEEAKEAAKQAKLAQLDEQEYSVFLTKSNIENFFGQYLFYKM